MPEVIRCSCHISLILILVSLLLWLLGSRVSRSLRRPVSLEDTSNHNGDTRNQWTTGRTVFNSPLQEESCRPAVRYHVKLLLPFLLLLADSKESKSLMADRRTLRDPGQNLYHHLRHRPNPRYSSLIHRCWSCSRSCLECYEDKYYNHFGRTFYHWHNSNPFTAIWLAATCSSPSEFHTMRIHTPTES